MNIQMDVKWFGGEVMANLADAAVRALDMAAQHVLTEANKTVPLDQGPLQRSGGTDIDHTALRASVYYGTPYARRQHEELGWRHQPGRRAKWLELTLQEQSDAVMRITTNVLKAALA